MFLSSACADACLQASDGCPNFSACESWEEVPEGCSLWGCHQTAGARNRTAGVGVQVCQAQTLCLERPSTGSGSSAQLSLAKPLAQLAWAASCAAEPQAEPRLACSHTPAHSRGLPNKAQNSKLHLDPASPLFPDSAFPPPEVLHQSPLIPFCTHTEVSLAGGLWQRFPQLKLLYVTRRNVSFES